LIFRFEGCAGIEQLFDFGELSATGGDLQVFTGLGGKQHRSDQHYNQG
jgi:hypothetical protein